MAELVSDKNVLFGDNSPAQRAEILGWMQIFNIELMNNVAVYLLQTLGTTKYDAESFDNSWKQVERQLSIIDAHLTKNTYLVGEKITLADLYCVPMLYKGLLLLWDPAFRARFPAVMRWFETVNKSPIFDGFFDNMKYATEYKRPQ